MYRCVKVGLATLCIQVHMALRILVILSMRNAGQVRLILVIAAVRFTRLRITCRIRFLCLKI